ncbi:MAG: hypothetical protein N3F07_00565 [Candidatus Micrarchaeota archaeon]|nr:hypothetical protein [Candidatus Micrarchaeota archaeon]
MGAAGDSLVDEIEAVIKEAAGKQEVVMIRLAVGEKISIPKSALAAELHRRFPKASIEMVDGKEEGSVVVKDIEVE